MKKLCGICNAESSCFPENYGKREVSVHFPSIIACERLIFLMDKRNGAKHSVGIRGGILPSDGAGEPARADLFG